MLFNENELKVYEKQLYKEYVETCPKCDGEGYIHFEDDDGYMLSKECSCLKKVKRDLQLLDWGIPKRYIFRKNIIKEIQDKFFYQKVKDYALSFSQPTHNIKNLFICGSCQNITLIATILAKKIATTKMNEFDRYYKVAYSLFNDILTMKLDDDKQKEFREFLYKSDVFIIDGIGFEFGRNNSKFSQTQLENIIKKRDNNCTPTILASTLKPHEMKELYGCNVYDFITEGEMIEAYSKQDSIF